MRMLIVKHTMNGTAKAHRTWMKNIVGSDGTEHRDRDIFSRYKEGSSDEINKRSFFWAFAAEHNTGSDIPVYNTSASKVFVTVTGENIYQVFFKTNVVENGNIGSCDNLSNFVSYSLFSRLKYIRAKYVIIQLM